MQTHSLQGLKTIRTMLHFKAQALADRLGIAVTSYGRHERGERRIYLDKAATLASMLEVPIEWLMVEPDIDRRQILWERGEKRRALLARAQGDESLAETSAPVRPAQPAEPAGSAPDEAAELKTLLSEWSEDDD